MPRLQESLRVLLPAFGLKRWLIMLFIGLLQIAIGTTIWLGNHLRSASQNPLIQLLTLRFIPRFQRGLIFLTTGTIVAYIGWDELSRSIMRVMLPEKSETGLREVLTQRHRAQHGRRVVVIGGDPGLTPILTALTSLEEELRIDVILPATEPGYRAQELQNKFGLSSQQVVFPITDDATLYAELDDGRLLEGYTTINRFDGGKINNLFLSRNLRRVQVWEAEQNGKDMNSRLRDYTPNISDAALSTLQRAQLIIFAPGLLYTQMLPNLSLPRFAQAIQESKSSKVYVANLMTQPGRTDNWTVADYIEAIRQISRVTIDYVVTHQGTISDAMIGQYRNEGANIVALEPGDHMNELIFMDTGEKTKLIENAVIISEDIVTERPQIVTLHRGADTILREMPVVRHDPDKLASIFRQLLRETADNHG